MSFPPGTEMFQFPGFASLSRYPCGWVSPFGNLRVNGRSPLTAAYRSVPRPSSPVHAKASTKCSFKSLDHFLRNQKSAVRCQTPERILTSDVCSLTSDLNSLAKTPATLITKVGGASVGKIRKTSVRRSVTDVRRQKSDVGTLARPNPKSVRRNLQRTILHNVNIFASSIEIEGKRQKLRTSSCLLLSYL
jgi:hypothetical protein